MIYVISEDMTEFERARRIPFMLPTTFLGKVIIEKSRGEVSLMEEDTIENIS